MRSPNLSVDPYDDSYEEAGYTYGTGTVPSMRYQTRAGSHKPSSGNRREHGSEIVFENHTSRSRIRRQSPQLIYSPRLGVYQRSYPSLSLPRSPSPYQREIIDPVRRTGFNRQPRAIEWHPADREFSPSSWSSRKTSYARPHQRLKQNLLTEPGLRHPASYERVRQGSRSGQQTEDSRQAVYTSEKRKVQNQTFEHPLRHDTNDWDESQGSGKRIRYNILLRSRNVQVSDMEKGYSQDDYGQDRSRRNRKTFHARETPLYPQEHAEIIQTRWIADDDLNEILTLTTQDDIDDSDRQNGSQKMRWV